MADTAVHLEQRVLPAVPIRHWLGSLPVLATIEAIEACRAMSHCCSTSSSSRSMERILPDVEPSSVKMRSWGFLERGVCERWPHSR